MRLLATLTMGFCSLLSANIVLADSPSPHDKMWEAHPFYFGILGGYGSTDWTMLVADCRKDPEPEECQKEISTSAPISAGDSGLVWGGTLGYEIKPSWAVEIDYMRFPDTIVSFSEDFNEYKDVLNIDVKPNMVSRTWSLIGVAKFLTEISNTGVRGFANAGIDFTGREDTLVNTIRVSATFGVGLNYVFPSHLMLEFAFQYVAGFGRANKSPAIDYIPFLYSLTGKLIYRI